MSSKRVLLIHISNISGHRSASLAIEKALREADSRIETNSIDIFDYVCPYWGRLVNRIYLIVVKVIPKFWDYLYDNKKVMNRIKRLRLFLHKINEKRIAEILDSFKPDAVVCTQAFPCGLLGDYLEKHNLAIPLIAVLTDFAPHGYWFNDAVSTYVVPSERIKQQLVENGIPEERVQPLGIPIDNKFKASVNQKEVFRQLGLNPSVPAILIMGGGQGLGPIKKFVCALDKLNQSVQFVVVCGTNKRLYRWLTKNKARFRQPLYISEYTDKVNDLMTIAHFIVTKPGGLTSAEALSKSLPMVIAKPLPGQEIQNTRFLLDAGVALKADNFFELCSIAEGLLSNMPMLKQLSNRAGVLAKADSAQRIAQHTLQLVDRQK